MTNFKIIGIDLAGNPKNSTGICFLSKNKLYFKTLFGDDEILECILKFNPDLIIIDAPLSLPSGRCCLSNKCSCSEIGGHFRAAEVEMRKYGRTLPLTFRGMRSLTERGMSIADKLKKEYKFIESHPRTIQKILGFKSPEEINKYYKIPSDVNEHELDAALLVLNGIFYLKEQFMEFGKKEEGIIVLPKKLELNQVLYLND